jgi:ABC-type phosphate transport system substrate-binding protein
VILSKPGVSALVLLALLALACSAHAELAVIVNPRSGVEQLSRSQVINIFLASNREFPGGEPAVPIDLPPGTPENVQFYRALVNRAPEQMSAYWSRLVFSGKASPPLKAGGWKEVIQAVAANPRAIGYVDAEHVDPARVKAVLVLP